MREVSVHMNIKQLPSIGKAVFQEITFFPDRPVDNRALQTRNAPGEELFKKMSRRVQSNMDKY
jgi:hypothetical protein